MRKMPILRAVGVWTLLAVTGVTTSCGRPADAADASDGNDVVDPLAALGAPKGAAKDQIRDLWLSMADEPLHHMTLARELLQEGDTAGAAHQLDTSAALLRWGRLYAHDSRVRWDFVATAQDLEQTSRRLRDGGREGPDALDRTLAEGLRAMAELHATTALEQWEAGEHTRAQGLLRASADEVQLGFSLSGTTPGGTIERALAAARIVADRLDSRSPPTEDDVRGAIEGLREGAASLGNLVASDRR